MYLFMAVINIAVISVIYWRYCSPLPIKGKFSLLLLLLSIGFLPGFIGVFQLNSIIPHVIYFSFTLSLVIFTLTIFRDVAWIVLYWLSSATSADIIPNPSHYGTKLLRTNAVTLLISLLITLYSLYEGRSIPQIRNVTICSSKLRHSYRVAILSDMHITRASDSAKLKAIVDLTNSQHPDIIILAGDTVDDRADMIWDKLEILKNLSAQHGIFAVAGNHEFYRGLNGGINAIKSLGFTFLENNGLWIDEYLYIGGIPDVFSYNGHKRKIDLPTTFTGSIESQFRILISHTPYDFGAQNNLFDLEVSGHTHGGQFFPFHIVAYLKNNFLAGMYELSQHTTLYVSRGVGQWGPQMRFLAPSEITLLELRPSTP